MKKLIISLAVIAAFCGCHRTPAIVRSGSICVQPIATKDFVTNDFVTVKPDLVDLIASQQLKELKEAVVYYKNLNLVDCGASEYELVTGIKRVNIENRLYQSPWTGQRMNLNRYEIYIDWLLKDKASQTVESGEAYDSGTDISKIVSSLGYSISSSIYYVTPK